MYNEEKMVIPTLQQVWPEVHQLIIVNDGSTDASEDRVRRWMEDKEGVSLISMRKNRGKAVAMREGLLWINQRFLEGKLAPHDIIITVDADGQHLGGDINGLCHYMLTYGYDMVITRRDFSMYPRFKIIGNRVLTWVASLLGGFAFRDIECGFRLFKVRVVPDLLKYYTGFHYSFEQETGVLAARLHYRISNDVPIKVKFYRGGGTKIIDGLLNISATIFSLVKLLLYEKKDSSP